MMLGPNGQSDFEALRTFRAMGADERMEALFLHARAGIHEAKASNARLDKINGTTATTANALKAHLDAHDEAQAGLDFMKVWGARGAGLVMFSVGVSGVVFGAVGWLTR